MKQRARIYYTAEQKALMWDRWQQGESLKLREIWAIRIRLQLNNRLREMTALFNLAIDSKLRAVRLKLSDVSHGASFARRAIIL